jgi:hypothetical protein
MHCTSWVKAALMQAVVQLKALSLSQPRRFIEARALVTEGSSVVGVELNANVSLCPYC